MIQLPVDKHEAEPPHYRQLGQMYAVMSELNAL